MPTYEYICRACGHEFEEFHSILAAPILACPSCRKKKVERKISGGGAVIFKGGGFYETDYRSESYRSGADVWGGEEVCELGDETVFAEVRDRCRGGLGRFISGPFHGEAAACQ